MNSDKVKESNETCMFIFEDQKIIANKLILSRNSPVFELMFYGPMAAGEVQICDINADDFKQMLDYVHTKNITLKSIPNSWSLFYIGHKYFLNDLKKVCLTFISFNLTLSTLLLSYEYSQLYNLEELANKCWREILLSAREILTLDYHMQASTFCALLDEDAINVSEEDLIKAAFKWATNECMINNFDQKTKYNLLITVGIFQRLRFETLDYTSLKNVYQLSPNAEILLPSIPQTFKRRERISSKYLGLRYRFREAYKIERNIRLMPETKFYCTLKSSCKIVVYGVAIAQPHQSSCVIAQPYNVTAVSNAEITILSSSQLLGSTKHDIIQGDYETPDLVHFAEGVEFESNVPYRICVKYKSVSGCKKPNELLCFYLDNFIKGRGNTVVLQFEDECCGGIVRGISYYRV